jgi:hypothetical protein
MALVEPSPDLVVQNRVGELCVEFRERRAAVCAQLEGAVMQADQLRKALAVIDDALKALGQWEPEQPSVLAPVHFNGTYVPNADPISVSSGDWRPSGLR